MTASDNVASVAWLNSRLMLELFMATRSLVIDDIVSGVLLAAVNNANTSYLDARPETASRYMGMVSVEDAMRRPASVSALARSLGVPRETARGKAMVLAEMGLIRAEPGGFVLPAEALGRAPLATAMAAYVQVINTFVEDLSQLGVFDLRPGTALSRPREAFGGGVLRLVAAHTLRTLGHVMELAPDLSLTSIYLLKAVAHLTGAHLKLDDVPPPAVLGQPHIGPVRGAAVAGSLDMPQETVRRHLKKLTETGRLHHGSDGYSLRFEGDGPRIWRELQNHDLVNSRQLIWKLNTVGALGG